ncbi:MAG: hypothetical protein GTO63_21720 [Anaerolineae bacterium]|nr:hypothetical protein [Anaerolineae bacterium]NIN97408.1 hypothetical protein [Anaerolineae bacterium]NIQ80337.1 hypothetical protein [Anaerolineae bacterium]
MGKRRKRKTSIDDWVEWQDHIFVPGYWTGGRIPPFLLGKRPNKVGYILLAQGLFCLTVLALWFGVWLARSEPPWTLDLEWNNVLALAFLGGVGALQIASGVALLRKPRSKKTRHKSGPRM